MSDLAIPMPEETQRSRVNASFGMAIFIGVVLDYQFGTTL